MLQELLGRTSVRGADDEDDAPPTPAASSSNGDATVAHRRIVGFEEIACDKTARKVLLFVACGLVPSPRYFSQEEQVILSVASLDAAGQSKKDLRKKTDELLIDRTTTHHLFAREAMKCLPSLLRSHNGMDVLVEIMASLPSSFVAVFLTY